MTEATLDEVIALIVRERDKRRKIAEDTLSHDRLRACAQSSDWALTDLLDRITAHNAKIRDIGPAGD